MDKTSLMLDWLPVHESWFEGLSSLEVGTPKEIWTRAIGLANHRLDLASVVQLDARLRKTSPDTLEHAAGRKIRLAVLASSTTAHLSPSLRVAALRRGCLLSLYSNGYGQYRQELLDCQSGLHRFLPDVVLVALDARHVVGLCEGKDAEVAAKAAVEQMSEVWRIARDAFGCQVIQQAIAPVFQPLMGGNEFKLQESAVWRISLLNGMLRLRADEMGVDILALDDAMLRYGGVSCWHDARLWQRAKQEIRPSAAPCYGDFVMRLVAARRGWSSKCLVLDLDNTIWGGVVGEQGLTGITLGQNSAEGEAFVEFQAYLAALARRGVILAVCSKNDEAMALLPFEHHPEMRLKRSDIAAFIANWNDKPHNIREIAKAINIGLEAVVFVDDNPFERGAVRRELPMVAVPELPDDPAFFADCIADAGYFESVSVTDEDRQRSELYFANAKREALRTTTTNLKDYLQSLNMCLDVQPFNENDASRIVQLINKTNQFNLTTKRCTDAEIAGLMRNEGVISLQFRLSDRFGDNGIIAVIIAAEDDEAQEDAYSISTWLMSCRVLGRQVEDACINALAAAARRKGAKSLRGIYIESERNQMVKDLYSRLGFTRLFANDERSEWLLELSKFQPFETTITLTRE